MNKPYTLEVIYETKGEGAHEWGSLDQPLELLLDQQAWAMDTECATGTRQVAFAFDNLADVDEAVRRVKAKFGLDTQIFDWTVDDPPKRIA